MGLGTSIEDFIKKRRIQTEHSLPGAMGSFYRAGGNSSLLNGISLTSQDTILDVGAFEGTFTTEVCWRFGSRCITIEPVPSFCAALRRRFSTNDRVRVVEAAVGPTDGEVELQIQGDGTSAFREQQGHAVRVRQIDIAGLVLEKPTPALLKLNIEGGEYDALERLQATGLLAALGSVLVQFHRVDAESEARRERIRKALSASHRETFCYPFVWERWDKLPQDNRT